MKRLLLCLWVLWATPAWATLQILPSGVAGAALNTGATAWQGLYGGGSWVTTEANVQSLAGAAGDFVHLRVTLTAAPGVGKSYAFTLRIAGANSALGCTISDSATTCSDTDTAAVTAAQTVGMQCVPTSTPDAANAMYTVMFIGTTAQQTTVGGGTHGDSLATSGSDYFPLSGTENSSTTETNMDVLLPLGGTFSGLRIALSGSPDNGAGTQSYVFTVRKNAAPPASPLTCTISETATTCSDTSNSVTVVAGDLVDVLVTVVGTPTARRVTSGVILTTTNDNEFAVMASDDAALGAAATGYARVVFANTAPNATETVTQQQSHQFAVTALYANVVTAPDNGAGTQSYTFTLRQDAADSSPAVTCAISEASLTCNQTGASTLVNLDDLLTTSVVPANTPVGSMWSISYAGFTTPRRQW